MDVAIIGGSVTGLQAALTLGRACRRVVLFDDGHARNRAASHVHNYLGAEEKLAPARVFVVVRQHQQSDLVERLGCQLADGAVVVDEAGRRVVSRAGR